MTLDIRKLNLAAFSAESVEEGHTIKVVLRGTADTPAMSGMASLLGSVHMEATRLQVTEVVMDLRELEFMNSSCFKTLVTWISNVQDMELVRQYKVRFLSDPNKHWQKRSLHALSCFAVDLVQVDT